MNTSAIILYLKKIVYPIFVSTIILAPNIFSVTFGLESFPYTCAPMFAHYINEDTSLYLWKFESVNGSDTMDLVDYYGKSESHFIRLFFSKVYGSSEPINPFCGRISDSEEDFHFRMNTFFRDYTHYLHEMHGITFDKINIKVKKVDQMRNGLTDFELIGNYDVVKEEYYSNYGN